MNFEQKVLRERKQSLNRPTQNCSSKQRSTSSLPKKNVSAYSPTPIHSGSYLLAWGQVPGNNQSRNPIKIAKGVIKYSVGQKHIVYLNEKYQAMGLGENAFGQLGLASEQKIIKKSQPLLEDKMVQEVFCTSYCTFLLTNRDELYGCGFNNRGQLGIGNAYPVSAPTKIGNFSKKSQVKGRTLGENDERFSSAKKSSKSVIKTHEERLLSKNTNESNLAFTESCETTPNEEQLLEQNQMIIEIVGGPFHTAILTSKGRVFYTGNIYKKSSLSNNEYTAEFTELNLRKIGKVQKIKSGLTCLALLNTQGSLFLLGALSQSIVCDEPYNVGVSCITDFGLTKDRIYLATAIGELYVLVQNKKSLKTVRWLGKQKSMEKIKQIHCGLNFTLLINENGSIYTDYVRATDCDQYLGGVLQAEQGQGQEGLQACEEREPDLNQILLRKICFGGLFMHEVKVGLHYGVGKCERGPLISMPQEKKVSVDSQEKLELLKKMKELEKQNKLLKELVKKESEKQNKRSKAQEEDLLTGPGLSADLGGRESKQSNLKFEISGKVNKISHKARTFDPSMEIAFEELELGKQISEGGYGVIYQAIWRKTLVAVKIFKIDTNSENSVKDFISECHAMEALRHPNIVMFLGACTKPPHFAIVLEYCPNGTLWSFMQSKSKGEISWEQRRNLALDTARGMNYLHQRPKPILHRDLKSLNLLLDENNRVKLADFGWTKGLENYMTGKIGTYQWMAPEVVSSHQYTEKADIFSFSIILWEIASREAPYRNIPGIQVAQDVLHKDLRPTIPKKTPDEFANLIRKCWRKEPDTRPSFIEIIEELQKMIFE